MDHHPDEQAPTGEPDASTTTIGDQVFEIRVAGLVPEDSLDHLGGIEVTSQELRTVLTGQFRDQAELHGFLARLRSLGLDIVEIRRVLGGHPVGPHTEGAH
jgi:hypothetical protein